MRTYPSHSLSGHAVFRSGRRQQEFDAGVLPDFLLETKHIRDDPSWRVSVNKNTTTRAFLSFTCV